MTGKEIAARVERQKGVRVTWKQAQIVCGLGRTALQARALKACETQNRDLSAGVRFWVGENELYCQLVEYRWQVRIRR